MFPSDPQKTSAEAPRRRAPVVDDEPLIRWSISEAYTIKDIQLLTPEQAARRFRN
jgi:hypothetical protein